MKDYKRVTIRHEDGSYSFMYDYNATTPPIKTLLDRLAELEDKIENGTLRDFPCTIGDEVFWAWDLDKQYSQVMRGLVIGLSISHKNTVWFSVKYDDGLSFDHTVEDYWLKSVFPTKAEAEAKLKGLQEKLK